MAILLRALCWNIAEGSQDRTVPDNSALPAIARQIQAKFPDIVMLNEIKNWRAPFGGGINQVKKLAELTGMPHFHWSNTNATGAAGHKAVGILSRYPLGEARYHPIMNGSSKTGYGTLETSLTVDGVLHHVLSTRFDAHNPGDNAAAHQQSVDLVRALDPKAAVIFGGDFNAGFGSVEGFPDFVQKSGLTNVESEKPDPFPCGHDFVDHIFYRGLYKVIQMERRCPEGNPSDHPWVFVEFCSPREGFAATYGATIKLKHSLTGGTLHSHSIPYGHSGSSGQQQVTAFGGYDDNDFWRIKGPDGQSQDFAQSTPVQHGNVIRLEHSTGLNLHSHPGHPSPVTGEKDAAQQEVTCFGANGIGDSNDNWRIEVEGGGSWEAGRRVRLIHVNTNRALHSHAGFSHPQWTMGQQEVTCFANRDDNDWWFLFQMR